jgi:hypothetical protein
MGFPTTQIDYQSRKECRDTTIYCVLSVMLLIAAAALNSPGFIEGIPGGQITVGLLSLVIFVAVLYLCIKQAPRL